MNIETAEFTNEELTIIKLNGRIYVNPESDNRWSRALDTWLSEGNEIEPYQAPAPSTLVSPTDFMDMIGFESLTSIEIAAESDPQIRVIVKYLSLSKDIDLTSTRLTNMLGLLWQKGLLTDTQITTITGLGE